MDSESDNDEDGEDEDEDENDDGSGATGSGAKGTDIEPAGLWQGYCDAYAAADSSTLELQFPMQLTCS